MWRVSLCPNKRDQLTSISTVYLHSAGISTYVLKIRFVLVSYSIQIFHSSRFLHFYHLLLPCEAAFQFLHHRIGLTHPHVMGPSLHGPCWWVGAIHSGGGIKKIFLGPWHKEKKEKEKKNHWIAICKNA